jgi:hypothetical protein
MYVNNTQKYLVKKKRQRKSCFVCFPLFSRQFKIIPRVEKAPSQNQHWRLISVFGGHSLGRNEPLKKKSVPFYLVEKRTSEST